MRRIKQRLGAASRRHGGHWALPNSSCLEEPKPAAAGSRSKPIGTGYGCTIPMAAGGSARRWIFLGTAILLGILACLAPHAQAQTRDCVNNACRVYRNHTIEIHNLTRAEFNATQFEEALAAAINVPVEKVAVVRVNERPQDDASCLSGNEVVFDARTDPITPSCPDGGAPTATTASPVRRRREANDTSTTTTTPMATSMIDPCECPGDQFIAITCNTTANVTQATCENCSMCDAGEFVEDECTLTTDTMCGSCPEGTYQNEPDHMSTMCKNCSMCDAGEFVEDECTLTTDTLCMVCEAGTYQDETDHLSTMCKSCSTCDAGEFVGSDCTLTANTTCAPCGDGTYQNKTDHLSTMCKNCSMCDPAMEYESSPCTDTSDRVCTPISECEPRFSRERYPPTGTSDRVCLDYREAAVTVVVMFDVSETEVDQLQMDIEAALMDGSQGPLAVGLRDRDPTTYNDTVVTYLPQVSRLDVPAQGRQFVYFTQPFANATTRDFDVQKLPLLDAMDEHFQEAANDSTAETTFMERNLDGTSVTALFRVESSDDVTGATLLDMLGAAIDDANISLTRSSPPDEAETVVFIDCMPCQTADHEGLYQDVTYCGGLCAPCTACTLDEFLNSTCEGTNDAVCEPLPMEFDTMLPVDLLATDSAHLLPVAATQHPDDTSLSRDFVFTNLAPGKTTRVAVSGEPQQDGDDVTSGVITRPLGAAASLQCLPVSREVYATYPTLAVVFEAQDEDGHARVTDTPITAQLEGTDAKEQMLAESANCNLPEDGVALCEAVFTIPDSWFPGSSTQALNLTYSTPSIDGPASCGQITLGPRPASVEALESTLAAVTTPTESLYEGDAFDVTVYARHNRPVHSFGVALRCTSCSMQLPARSSESWSLSTASTDEGAGVVVGGVSRLAPSGPFGEQRTFELFTVQVVAQANMAGDPLSLEGDIDTFVEFRGGNRQPIIDTRFEPAPLPILANTGAEGEASGSVTKWEQPVQALGPLRAHVFVNGGLGLAYDLSSLTNAEQVLPLSYVGVWPRNQVLRPVQDPIANLSNCALVTEPVEPGITVNDCTAIRLLLNEAPATASTTSVTLKISVDGIDDFGSTELTIVRPASRLSIASLGASLSADDGAAVLRRVREVYQDEQCSDQRYTTTRLQVWATFPDDVQADVTGLVALSASNNAFAVDSSSLTITGVSTGDGTLTCENHDCSSLNVRVVGDDDVPAVVLGTDTYAIGGASFAMEMVPGNGVLRITTQLSTSTSSLDLFTDTADAARLHSAAVVMEQVTQARHEMPVAPAFATFASSNEDVATVTQTDANVASVQTQSAAGTTTLSVDWSPQTCATRTYSSSVDVTTAQPTLASLSVDVAAVDLVVPADGGDDVLGVTNLPDRASFIVTSTLDNGASEMLTSVTFDSSDEGCPDFVDELVLQTDDVRGKCEYTATHEVGGETRTASVTVNKFALSSLQLTASVSATGASATHASGSGMPMTASLEVAAIGENAETWPALRLGSEVNFSTTGAVPTRTFELPLRQVAQAGTNAAGLALQFSAVDDGINEEDAVALQMSGSGVQATASAAGNATFTASFGDTSVGVTVQFTAEDSGAAFAVLAAGISNTAADDSGVFALEGRANATFSVNLTAELGNMRLSPEQVRLEDGTLAVRSLVDFRSSSTDALTVDEDGIVTLVAGSADVVNVSVLVDGMVAAEVSCLPSLLPAEGAGGFGPHASSAASFNRVRVPLHVQGSNLRAADLQLTYDSDFLQLATVEAGADVRFASTQFSQPTDREGALDVFVIIPGAGVTSDDLEVAVAVFDARNLTSSTVTSRTLTLAGRVVEVTGTDFAFVDLEEATTVLSVSDDSSSSSSRRRRSSSSSNSDAAAAPTLPTADPVHAFKADAGAVAETPEVIVARALRSLHRVRRSGPRGTLQSVLAQHPDFDMNGDGELDVLDVLLLADVYSGQLPETELAPEADADANSDGVLTFDDVEFLLAIVAGRLVAIQRVAVTPVQAPDSDCRLSFNISVLLPDLTLGSPAANDTRLYLDLLGASEADFDTTFDTAAVTADGPNYGFVRLPYQMTDAGAANASYFLQVDTPLASSMDRLGVSVLQLDASGAYNFHARQTNMMGTNQSGPVINSGAYDVGGVNVSLFLPFGYTPIQAFNNTLSTNMCLDMRQPQGLALNRPSPDSNNVVNGRELTLAWAAPATPPLPVTAYFVQYRDLNVTGAGTIEKRVNSSMLAYKLTEEVLPYHDFEVQVQVEFGNRRSVISGTVVTRTHQDTPSTFPSFAAVNVVNSTAVKVVWTPLSEEDRNGIVQYVVRVQRLDGQARNHPGTLMEFNQTLSHPASQTVFAGLEENILYNVSIRAQTNADTEFAISATPFSPPITVETHPAPPDVPPTLVSNETQATSFRVTWVEPVPHTHNTDLLGYNVRVRRANTTSYADGTAITTSDFPSGADDWHSFFVYNDTLTLEITSLDDGATTLHPAIDYEFQLQTDGGFFDGEELLSPWSPVFRVRLLDAEPSGNVTGFDFSQTAESLSVEWELPAPLERNGVITNFSVTYSREEDDVRVDTDALSNCPGASCTANVVGSGDDLYTWSLSDLEAYVTYTVEVRPFTSAGAGPATVQVIRTNEDIPSVPVVLGQPFVNTSHVRQPFEPLALPDRNGEVKYRVNIIRVDSAFFNQRVDTDLAQLLPSFASVDSQPNNTYTVASPQLQPYMEYNVEVVPYTNAGDGEAVNATIITKEATPEAPAISVQQQEDSNEELKVVRVTVDLPSRYLRNGVIQNVDISYSNLDFKESDVSTTPVTEEERDNGVLERDIGMLRAGITYTFNATITNRATLVAAESPSSDSETIRTDEYLPTGAVRDLQAEETTDQTDSSKAVEVTWKPPLLENRNGDITEYHLETLVIRNGETEERTMSDDTLSLSTLGANDQEDGLMSVRLGLGAYDKYRFRVTPATAIGLGTTSDTTETQDNGGILSPALPGQAVTGLTLTTGIDTISATWNALSVADWNDEGLEYRVVLTQLQDEFSDSPSEQELNQTVTANTAIMFHGLQEYVMYRVDVWPINSVFISREGNFDDNTLLTTKSRRTEAAQPAVAPGINQASITQDSHSITLSWSALLMHEFNGRPASYVVRYRGLGVTYVANAGMEQTADALDTVEDFVALDSFTGAPTVTLEDLEPNREYEISVAARNLDFESFGPFSDTVTVKTWSFRPQTPLPTVTFHEDRPEGVSSKTTLRVTWPVINTRYGPIRRIQVVVEPEESLRFNQKMYNCTLAEDSEGDSNSACDFGTWQTNQDALDNKQTPVEYITFQRDYDGNDPLQTSGSLVIGDETNRGGKFNGRLMSGGTYTVRLIAFTEAADDSEMFGALGPLAEPVTDEKGRIVTGPRQSTSSSSTSPAGAIAGVIVTLLVVGLVIGFVWYRRKNQKPVFESPAPANGAGMVHSTQSNPQFAGGYSAGSGYPASMATATTSTASSLPMSPLDHGGQHLQQQQQQQQQQAPGLHAQQHVPGQSMATTSFGGPPVPSRPAHTMSPPVVAAGDSSIYSSMGSADAGVPQLPPVQRHEVSVQDLPRVIGQMSANSNFIFSEEYECVEKGDQFPRMASQMDVNRSKNRYANILAYDYTRVKLSVIGGDPNSDYINANYIDGYSVPKYYIAAQGPLPHTVIDFWRMIWEQRTTVIIMVTRLEEKGRIKCHQYWPQAAGDQLPLTTNMSIWFTKQEEFPDFVIRTLTVQVGQQSRTVTQFQYVSWPDHGVPDSTAGIITMLRKAKVLRNQPNAGAMLVHCSAGVGRTGTFIALDYNLDKAAREGKVDVFGCLNMMRRQRNTMVQTEDQYIFIYSSLCDALSTAVTEMSPKTLRKHFQQLRRAVPGSNMSNLEQEFNRLAQGPAPVVRTDSAQILANKEKNRFNNILPFDNTRVKLQTVPGVVGSDYINASFIDGFKQKHAFIATQGPMENTLADFWRMIWEQGAHSIVMMTHLEENGRVKSEQYWPDPDEPPLNFGDYQVTLLSEVNRGFYMERTMILVNLLLDDTREVKQWQYLEWPTQGTPSSGVNLVRMVQEIEYYAKSQIVAPQEESIYGNREVINEHAILQQMKPLVVHCSAGVGRTGVYIAAMICLKRMREERKMDLYQVTKHMRTQRMAMIQTPDQYAYVYRVVLDWLDMSAPAQAQAQGGPQSVYSNASAGSQQPRLSLQQEVDATLPQRSESESDTTRVYNSHNQPAARGPPPTIPPKSASIKLKAHATDESGYGFDA